MNCAEQIYNATELMANNNECVVLKVKDGKEMELISTGYFDGDETMMRLTKGESVTCTVWRKDGTHSSWYWGLGGYACVTEATKVKGYIIRDTIQKYYKIFVSKFA